MKKLTNLFHAIALMETRIVGIESRMADFDSTHSEWVTATETAHAAYAALSESIRAKVTIDEYIKEFKGIGAEPKAVDANEIEVAAAWREKYPLPVVKSTTATGSRAKLSRKCTVAGVAYASAREAVSALIVNGTITAANVITANEHDFKGTYSMDCHRVLADLFAGDYARI